jgi:PAS domain S-box-containing protein
MIQSQEQYESLVHSIDGIVWEVDAETFRFTFVSKQAERILGYPVEQWLGPTFWVDHLHPDDHDWAIDFCTDATKRRADHQFEYRMIGADGCAVWVRDLVTVHVQTDGSVRLRGVMFDITEHKRAEALLYSKEQEFRAIVENAPDQIIRFDRQFRLTYVNPAVSRVYGMPADALTGKLIGSVVQDAGLDVEEDEVEQLCKRIEAVFDTGKSSEFEMTWPIPAGRRYYSARLFPELDPDGSVINVLGIGRDITESKQADVALRAQKETLQKIVDHMPVMINFTDSDGRINLVNREWQQTLGWSLDEIRNEGVDIIAECYPDPNTRQEVKKFIESATGDWVDFKTRKRDGSFIDTSWARVRLSDGTTLGIGQDITERRRADQSLRLFRTLIDQSSDAIHVIDPETLRFLDCNKSAYEGLGYSREEFLFLDVYDIDPIFVESMLEGMIEEMDRSGFVMFESIHRRKDGSTFPVEVNLKTISLEKDYRLAVVRDITERKHAEEALRKSKDSLRLVIDTIPTMVWSLRADGSVDFVNKRWTDYTGISLEEEAAEPTRVIHPDDVPRTIENWLVAKAAGEAAEDEVRLQGADGEYRWFLVRTAPLRDEQGNVVKWFGVSINIEDRKLAEDSLRATSEQLRALSASLQSTREEEGRRIAREIHDELGSALTSLRWDLESFEKVISESTDQSQLQVLRGKIDAMLKLTETTIGSVRRISAELRPTVLDDLGPVEAIEWQAEQFQARTGIICSCDCSSENLELSQTQSTAIFRIFQEALTNILRHAGATRVEITMLEKAGEFVLTISDNGRGITEAEKSESGSLGLLGMRERAHLIGGKIDITGTEGQGTVIVVRIPTVGLNDESEMALCADFV